jgi:hypothetical protein
MNQDIEKLRIYHQCLYMCHIIIATSSTFEEYVGIKNKLDNHINWLNDEGLRSGTVVSLEKQLDTLKQIKIDREMLGFY